MQLLAVSKKRELKNKSLIITTILLFLVVNLNHFWEGKLGILAFPVFIFLALVFLILAIIGIIQIGKSINEKFVNKTRNWTIGIMLIGLGLIFIKPGGIINFDRLEGENLFIAQREGAANCMIILKLKTNNKFKERSVCFGVSEVRGDYEIKNDTIFFSNVSVPRGDEEYYEYAIIQQSKYNDEKALFRYRNTADSTGNVLSITKNEILK